MQRVLLFRRRFPRARLGGQRKLAHHTFRLQIFRLHIIIESHGLLWGLGSFSCTPDSRQKTCRPSAVLHWVERTTCADSTLRSFRQSRLFATATSQAFATFSTSLNGCGGQYTIRSSPCRILAYSISFLPPRDLRWAITAILNTGIPWPAGYRCVVCSNAVSGHRHTTG